MTEVDTGEIVQTEAEAAIERAFYVDHDPARANSLYQKLIGSTDREGEAPAPVVDVPDEAKAESIDEPAGPSPADVDQGMGGGQMADYVPYDSLSADEQDKVFDGMMSLSDPDTSAGILTLDAAAGRYFVEVAEHQPSAGTTEYQLANLIRALGKDTLLSEITDNEIAELVARRRGHKDRHGNHFVAPATVNRETQLLKRVMRRAETTWKKDTGEAIDWKALMLPEPVGRTRELRSDEEGRFLQHLREDMHPLVRFCIMCGPRLMSAARLTWSSVDFESREIIFRTKSKRPGGEIHTVPITQAMLVLLAEQRGNHPIYVFTYICKRSRGQRRKGERYPFSPGGWRRDWKRALQDAGIEDFRFHDTRHTAATRTLRGSGNLKVVQEMLGHSDIAMTARYAHATTGDVRAAMEVAQSRNTPEAAGGGSANSLKKKA